jgi:hypothetical protein
MTSLRHLASTCFLLLAASQQLNAASEPPIPLPEHPRPDFQREAWQNLNGTWEFREDPKNEGLAAEWFNGQAGFPDRITVPFSWEAPLSGKSRRAKLAWYCRDIEVPPDWSGKRIFLIIGACDWGTDVWLDGKPLGGHQGGYTPFEFDLTDHVRTRGKHRLILRVDDEDRSDRLVGKQGYGNARGIWQTVYLEARPAVYFNSVHFLPDVPNEKVSVVARMSGKAPAGSAIRLRFREPSTLPETRVEIPSGATEHRFEVQIPNARLWSLEDPYLHELDAILDAGGDKDTVSIYFGMRRVHVMNLPGTEHPWVALNGKPVYLQMVLDQAHHPKGYYTFPTDDDLRGEIVRTRRLGLNGIRFHVKIESPRKLYWADRLGVLVMADVPHWWVNPVPAARADWEHAWRRMLERDFNHPSVFSWVLFNETWGLMTPDPGTPPGRDGKPKLKYLPETQEWVRGKYREAKQLDPTRLIEDNSPCNEDHVETDLNSFHRYIPFYGWREYLEKVTSKSFVGSEYNFTGGNKLQPNTPLINSECGNVWGYEGSAGDMDWSFDYHAMINEFRRFPEVGGWLFTELHDVPNEWNGYYRYDRSEKFTGLEELMPGMRLNELHSPFHLSTGFELVRDAKPGETVKVPLWASFLSDRCAGGTVHLRAELGYWDTFGQWHDVSSAERAIPFQPWLSRELEALPVTMPDQPGLALVRLSLRDGSGTVLHRNFTSFRVASGETPRSERATRDGKPVHILRFAPAGFTDAKWSLKQWNVLDGLKVNGAGHGFFEYRIPWPKDVDPAKVTGASLIFEASAKRLLGKDRVFTDVKEQNAVQGRGTRDPGGVPNSYPMTDTSRDPSVVRVVANGSSLGQFDLDDDPADHRGLLSWHAQLRDRKLRETGSYGYLINATFTSAALKAAAETKELVLRFEVSDAMSGGLALYGENFGRYPLDPTLVFTLKP